MLPACRCEQLAYNRRRFWLVAAAHKQHKSTQQHIDGKTIVRASPVLSEETLSNRRKVGELTVYWAIASEEAALASKI